MSIAVNFHNDAIFHSLSHFLILDNDVRFQLVNDGFSEESIIKQLSTPGSKFIESFAQSPQEVVKQLKSIFPQRFENVQPEDDGRARLSFRFETPVGIANIIDEQQLTSEEYATLRREERNGYIIRTIDTRRKIFTCECQLILALSDNGYEFCSTFPGELAPPLPFNGELSHYWDTHIFIRQI